MKRLDGQVALVTGASRGIGRGIGLGLAEAGATVYVTGRTKSSGDSHLPLSGSLDELAREIGAKAIVCDHTDDEQTAGVIETIEREQGRLDILVNNVWGGYEHYNDGTPFWEEKGFWTVPFNRWDRMFQAGVRAHYVTSALAAPMMIKQGRGVIFNVSALAAFKAHGEVAYGIAKAADVRMVELMAAELREHGVAALTIIPGLVRTEAVMAHENFFDLSNSESPQFIGRAVAALTSDPHLLELSGRWFIAAEVAQQYGFADLDGKQPASLRSELAESS